MLHSFSTAGQWLVDRRRGEVLIGGIRNYFSVLKTLYECIVSSTAGLFRSLNCTSQRPCRPFFVLKHLIAIRLAKNLLPLSVFCLSENDGGGLHNYVHRGPVWTSQDHGNANKMEQI